jgi:O-antigen/teichoic acid export membrane protein
VTSKPETVPPFAVPDTSAGPARRLDDSDREAAENATRFSRLLRNAAWNLAGNVLPLAAAAILIPPLISNLGLERFGLLSLAWVLVGYFSLFDLGLGRTITKMIAERVGSPREGDIPSIASTGLIVLLAIGCLGAACIAAIAPLALRWLPTLSPELDGEARTSLYLVAVSIPLVVATSGLRGVLEGLQEFRLLNLIRIPAGILLFAAPAITSFWSARLDYAILALTATRAIVLAVHAYASLARVDVRASLAQSKWVRPMVRFGGWLTVSSVLGPVIVYLDRFVLGAILSAEAIAYYSAPFEIVSRMLILPSALTVAMFPVLADLGERSLAESRVLRRRATWLVMLAIVPICGFCAAAAEPLLRVWLNPAFAVNSAVALQLLLPGFALNSLAQLPVTSLYSAGHARPVALLHLVQLPIYASLVTYLVVRHGIAGAAAAWSIRAAIDCVALFALLHVLETRRGRDSGGRSTATS